MAGFEGSFWERQPRSPRTQVGEDAASGGERGRASAPRRRNILWRFRRVLFLFALVVMAGVVGAAAFVSRLELADPEELHQSSYICAGDLEPGNCTAEKAIARMSDADDRTFVSLEDIPDHLKNAVISAEDRDFYTHKGVSPQAIARALYQDVRGSSQSTQGGSTITQQYVKNAYLTAEKTYDRKVREAVLAMKLEQQVPKAEILENYLNTIYLGRNSIGVQAASQVYFGKDVQDIDLAQAALLAGIIRAPTYADPDEYPEEAERRRTSVLDAMVEEGYITEDESAEAEANAFEDVTEFNGHEAIRTSDNAKNMGSEYIAVYVKQELENLGYTDEEITGGGLRVHTTLDLELQRIAYDVVYNPENGLLNQEGDPAAALVSLDDQGRVRAMVGGEDFRADSETAQVNFALRPRPVGSTFKPVAVAAAVQDGYSLTNSSYNSPSPHTIQQDIEGCAEEWELSNYSETSREGYLNLVEATAESSNTAFAQLMEELTPERVWQMAEELGMTRPEERVCTPSVLGSDDQTPLQMAEVFSVLANRGKRYEPQIITRVEVVDPEGNVRVDWEGETEPTQIMPEEKADLVTHALRAVVDEGTGKAAQIEIDGEPYPVAGKTGTSSDNKDALFIGYTPSPGLTTAVWMGYPEANWDPECTPEEEEDEDTYCKLQIPPMNEDGLPVRGGAVAGGGLPAQIWQAYMTFAIPMKGLQDNEFPEVSEEKLREGQVLGQATRQERPDRGRGRGRGDDGDFGRPGGPGDRPETTRPTLVDPCLLDPNRPGCQEPEPPPDEEPDPPPDEEPDPPPDDDEEPPDENCGLLDPNCDRGRP